MIKLPPQLSPSELLALDQVTAFVTRLLETSRSLQLEGRWQEAEQSAGDALEGSRQAGAQVSRGAARTHLADIHLATGRTGRALHDARTAHRLFAAQPSRFQRHNEAVAAYARGLAHHTLGDRVAALRWYEKSSQLLARVIDDWSAEQDRSRVRSCQRLQRWLVALSDCLTDADTAGAPGDPTSLWLPLLLSDVEPRFAVARLDVERYVVGGTLQLGGQTFRIELLGAPAQPSLRAEADYYALRIPRRALPLLQAEEGDYAVIVRQNQPDREGPGVLETLSGVEFGDFQRGPSGRIRFVRPDATVIGGSTLHEDFPVGYVTALLKRA